MRTLPAGSRHAHGDLRYATQSASRQGTLGSCDDTSDARSTVRHLPRRRVRPGHGHGRRRGARAPRRGGRVPGRADLLRPAGVQRGLRRGGRGARPPHNRRALAQRRAHRRALGLVRGHDRPPVPDAAEGRPGVRRACGRGRLALLRVQPVRRGRAGRGSCRGPGARPLRVPRLVPRAARPRRATATGVVAGWRGRRDPRGAAGSRCLLRFRRPLLREDAGGVGVDARPEARCGRRVGRHHARRDRPELPDAHGGRPAAARQRRPRGAPGRRARGAWA